MEPLISLNGVTKWYPSASGRYHALTDLSLQIDAGEYVVIVGRSGSGKSTLLNMLTGIDHPSAGTVHIAGTSLTGLEEEALARWRGRHIGIVFQFFQLIPTLTVLENILLAMEFVDLIPSEGRTGRAQALLALVGIEHHAHKFPAMLSGGEQQRAAIARALANDPPILVADEPTGNLDSHTALMIQRLFIQLVAEGKTVVMVTHDPHTMALGQRVITLHDGSVIDDSREVRYKVGAAE